MTFTESPFLRRYSRITGDNRYLDEAAKQFLLFKKYLYMPDHQIMSHVFDFKYGELHRSRGAEAMAGVFSPFQSF